MRATRSRPTCALTSNRTVRSGCTCGCTQVSNAASFVEPVFGQTFEDVEPGSTFYEFIQRLTDRGIMSGYACGGAGEPCAPGNRPYFRPGNMATRAQTSKIVANAFFPECTP